MEINGNLETNTYSKSTLDTSQTLVAPETKAIIDKLKNSALNSEIQVFVKNGASDKFYIGTIYKRTIDGLILDRGNNQGFKLERFVTIKFKNIIPNPKAEDDLQSMCELPASTIFSYLKIKELPKLAQTCKHIYFEQEKKAVYLRQQIHKKYNIPEDVLDTITYSELRHIQDILKKVNTLSVDGIRNLTAFLAKNHPQLIDKAIEMTLLITDSYMRNIILSDISKTLARAHPELIDKAIEITLLIEYRNSRHIAQSEIAKTLVKKHPQRIDKAMKIIRLVTNVSLRSDAQLAIATPFAKERPELFDEAIETTLLITDSYMRNHILSDISKTLAKKHPGLIDKAIKITRLIEDEYRRSVTQSEIAETFAKKYPGLIDKVIKITRLITDGHRRSISQSNIARTLATEHPELKHKALKITRAITNKDSRTYAQREIALIVENQL
ncbi:hypothetical protein HOG98_05600 [bacterium]|jgi:hypothetical protein|nr:hypothetical protein [bacterium]